MTWPWQGCWAGSQPRCTSATAKLRATSGIYTAGPAGAASHRNTASPMDPYLRSTWGGNRQANKEPGCCRYLPQEKKGCGRKRTWRGHSHRAERGQAGRAPPSRIWDPWHRQGQAPSRLGTGSESLWGEGQHELGNLGVSESSVSHAEHSERLVLI